MNDCDEWTGCRNPDGYGQIRRKGKTMLAHRLRFFEVFGWWPPVDRHRCDNPPCRNPWHLLPGTVADNNRDMIKRGRYTAPPTLNPGMPDERTDRNAYRREQRRRKKAGTWIHRQLQEATA